MIEPNLPGTDINNPEVLAGAKRVATRRNNDARRKLQKERAALPLFAGEIPSEPAHLVTPEEVIERRKLHQQWAWENGVERDIAEIERIRGYRNEVFSMVSDDEYTQFYAASLEWRFPQWAYWCGVREKIKRRSELMPADAEMVLTWLVDWEGEPPTIGELHEARGDGMTWRQIYEALGWLEDRHYVRGHQIRPCKFATDGYSAPFSATEAGKSFINS